MSLEICPFPSLSFTRKGIKYMPFLRIFSKDIEGKGHISKHIYRKSEYQDDYAASVNKTYSVVLTDTV